VLVDGADERLKKIIARLCEARNAQLIELEVMPDHVHLLVDVDPQFGVHRLVKEIKGTRSHELRRDGYPHCGLTVTSSPPWAARHWPA
jgi:putative transposase